MTNTNTPTTPKAISPRQLGFLTDLMADRDYPSRELDRFFEKHGQPETLTSSDASALIGWLISYPMSPDVLHRLTATGAGIGAR